MEEEIKKDLMEEEVQEENTDAVETDAVKTDETMSEDTATDTAADAENEPEEEAADSAIAAVKKLSEDVGIPADLKGILKEEDIAFLAESAYADACRPGNPRETSVEEIIRLYKGLM